MASRSGVCALLAIAKYRRPLGIAAAVMFLLAGCASDDGKNDGGPTGPGPWDGGAGAAPDGDPSTQARINGEILLAVPDGTEYSTPREVRLVLEQPYLFFPGNLEFTLECDLWEPEPPLGYFPQQLRIGVQTTLWEPLDNLVDQTFSCGRILWHGGVCEPCDWDGECSGYYANDGQLTITFTEWDPQSRHIAGTFACTFLDTSSLVGQEDPGDPVTYNITDGAFSATYISGRE